MNFGTLVVEADRLLLTELDGTLLASAEAPEVLDRLGASVAVESKGDAAGKFTA